MKTSWAEVVENERVYADTWIAWFRSPEIGNGAYPGQFMMLRCSDDATDVDAPATTYDLQPATSFDPLLPRPMSFHRVRNGAHGPEWAILYDVVGRGTAWLSRRKPGDRVYGWGPLGRGYEIGHTSRNLLLVAGGIGVAPLVWLADEAVAKGLSVTMIARRARRGTSVPVAPAAAGSRSCRHHGRRLGRAPRPRDGAVR